MSTETPGGVFSGVQFDPAAAGRAATGLDALGDRLSADLEAATQALTVPSAGTDEVSVRAANSANEVATSYLDSAQASVREMRKLAATLRAQAATLGAMDSANAGNLGGADTV
ncbi:PE domain-containing protein [Nocardia sp. BMG51109]|uniref:PE domain-containing protein n=1 Tax=Nocardia sp. BMG51109 TaxID=1056816 RepID=UPI0004BBF07A|nr:PE domain-containing protein [Nocardia sp. BMG51109]